MEAVLATKRKGLPLGLRGDASPSKRARIDQGVAIQETQDYRPVGDLHRAKDERDTPPAEESPLLLPLPANDTEVFLGPERGPGDTRRKPSDTSERATTATRPSPPGPQGARGGRRASADFKKEERSRGKRLFGGLLSALNQSTVPNSQQRKRVEIERRQLERARQKRAEDEERRHERLDQLRARRKREQIRFDKQVMHTRHSNLLASARSLETKTEPKLYYRPWRLTEAQEQLIDGRIRSVEGLIEREKQDCSQARRQRLEKPRPRPGDSIQPHNPRGSSPARPPQQVGDERSPEDANNDQNNPDSSSHRAASPATLPPPSRAVKVSPHEVRDGDRVAAVPKDHDENVDDMVQDKEDTVLY